MHYHIGAHIKKESGSLLKTIQIIQQNDGNALQLFVSNPRSAQIPNMQVYKELANDLLDYCKKTNFKLVIHSSYTVNLSKEPKQGKRVIDLEDCYWINLLLHELMVADIIGAVGVVVHVGKHTTNSPEKGLEFMFKAMSFVTEKMRESNMQAKLILETPAGAGTELLKTAEEFIAFYNMFSATDKKHLGICLDTAHIWSSGYDVSKYYSMISKHNAKDIVVVHLNNSKKEKASKVDVHEKLLENTGKIPLEDLAQFLGLLKHKPMIILETPGDDLQKEIKWVLSSTI
jgi:deoxyribonuclease-4